MIRNPSTFSSTIFTIFNTTSLRHCDVTTGDRQYGGYNYVIGFAALAQALYAALYEIPATTTAKCFGLSFIIILNKIK